MKYQNRVTFNFLRFIRTGIFYKKQLLFIFLSAVIFTNCKDYIKVHEPTTITGSCDNKAIEKLYLYKSNGVSGGVLIDSALVQSKKFKFSIHDLEEGYFYIKSLASPNSNSKVSADIYLMSGDTLNIVFSNNNKTFEGSTAHLQDYSLKQWQYIKNDSLYKAAYEPRYEICKRSIAEATSIIETIRKKQIAFFDNYFKNKLLPKKFKAVKLADMEYKFAQKYYWFLKYHKYMTEEEETYEYLAVDPSYYTFLDRINLNDEVNHLSYSYTWFLDQYLDDIFFRTTKGYDEKSRKENLRNTKNSELKFKAQWIKDNLKGINKDLGFYSLSSLPTGSTFNRVFTDSLELFYKELKPIYSYISKNYTDSTITSRSKKTCEDYLKIKPGAKSPSLTLPDINGNLVTLDSFLGNVVYIDFWGTWCGPCIAAIPDHRKLQKKFSNEKVIFLNIALEAGEKEIEAWRSFLNKNDFPGTHVVAENQFRNEQIQPFMIEVAPSYILIDKNGRIAYTRAPKPDKAEEAINDLLYIK